jgi:hypothetical protein
MLGQYFDKPFVGCTINRPLLKKDLQAAVVTRLYQRPFFRPGFDSDRYSHKTNLAST